MSENFTTYTEVDPGDDVSITSTTITCTTLPRHLETYVYSDKGVGHFDGDFEHTFQWKQISATQFYIKLSWMLSNYMGSWLGHGTASEPFLGVGVNNPNAADTPQLLLYEYDGATAYTDSTGDLSNNTDYWLTVKRDEAVGAYGTLYLYVYSDSDRTVLVDTLSVLLHAKRDLRYIYGLNNYGTGTLGHSYTGNTSNLDLQEVTLIGRIAGFFGIGRMGIR